MPKRFHFDKLAFSNSNIPPPNPNRELEALPPGLERLLFPIAAGKSSGAGGDTIWDPALGAFVWPGLLW